MSGSARCPGRLLAGVALLLATGCTDAREVEVRLSLGTSRLEGPGVTYRRGRALRVEGDLLSSNGTRASVVLGTDGGAWVTLVLATPDGRRSSRSERVDLIGSPEPRPGDRWLARADDALVLEVVFVDGVPPAAAEPRSSAPPPPPPLGSPAPPPDDGSPGCGGPPRDDEPDEDPWAEDEAGSGCGGDPVDAPERREEDDNARWDDAAPDRGSGCGGDPVDDPEPGDDNERWDDEGGSDDGASCGGDPVDDAPSARRAAARSLHFAAPFALVLAVNRGARRRGRARARR